jgi:outer membrane immunogenic protein
VTGIEVDASWGGVDGGSSLASPLVPGRVSRGETQFDWFATAAARLGYLVTPSLLVFAKGGLAWTEAEYGGEVLNPDGSLRTIFAGRENRFGWTLGGGAEWGFAASWSLKAEYQYLDFGSDLHSSLSRRVTTGELSTGADDTELDFHIVRLGLNYHFD